MPTRMASGRRVQGVPAAVVPDPYHALIAAIVARAVADAQGQCSPAVSRPVGEIQREAVAWLTASDEVTALLELAGYEPEPVLRRVRQLLPLEPKGTWA